MTAATAWETYKELLPQAILPTAGESFAGGYFFSLLYGETQVACLYQGVMAATATLIDAAIMPLIPLNDYPRVNLALRHVIVITVLNACGAQILLVNTMAARMLWSFKVNKPKNMLEKALNSFLSTMAFYIFLNRSLEKAVVRATILATAKIIDELLRPIVGQVLPDGILASIVRSVITFTLISQVTSKYRLRLEDLIFLHLLQPVTKFFFTQAKKQLQNRSYLKKTQTVPRPAMTYVLALG